MATRPRPGDSKTRAVGGHKDEQDGLEHETAFLISDSKTVKLPDLVAGHNNLRVAAGRAVLGFLVLGLVVAVAVLAAYTTTKAANAKTATAKAATATTPTPTATTAITSAINATTKTVTATAKRPQSDREATAKAATAKAATAKAATAKAATAKAATANAATAKTVTAKTVTAKAATAKAATAKAATAKAATAKAATAKQAAAANAANAKTAKARESLSAANSIRAQIFAKLSGGGAVSGSGSGKNKVDASARPETAAAANYASHNAKRPPSEVLVFPSPQNTNQAFRAQGSQRSKNRNDKAGETSTRIVVNSDSPAAGAGLKPHVDISEADLRQKPLAGILLQHVKQVVAYEMAEQQKAENKPASPGLTAGEEQKMKTQDPLVASISRYDDTARRCGLPTFEFGVDGKGNFCASKWITLVGGGSIGRPDAGGGPHDGLPRTLQRSAVAARIATGSSRTVTAAEKITRPTTPRTTSTTLGVAPNFPDPQPLFHLTERAVYMISMSENGGPRRANLTRDVALLSPKATIVEAVDGNKEKEVRTLMGPASLYPRLPRRRGAVLGCALSHLKSVNLAVQQGREHAIFFEEDVSLDLWPLWVRSIDDYLDKSPELSSSSTPFQAVQLGWTGPHYRKFNMSRSTIVPQAGSWGGTFAFTLSRAGMERVHKKFFRRTDNTISFEEMEQKCPPIVADDCVFGFCGPASELSLWHEGRTKLLPRQFFTEPPFFAPKPIGGIHEPDRSLCDVMKLQYQNCKDLLAAERIKEMPDFEKESTAAKTVTEMKAETAKADWEWNDFFWHASLSANMTTSERKKIVDAIESTVLQAPPPKHVGAWKEVRNPLPPLTPADCVATESLRHVFREELTQKPRVLVDLVYFGAQNRDSLEIRMQELKNEVSLFVVVESDVDHKGNRIANDIWPRVLAKQDVFKDVMAKTEVVHFGAEYPHHHAESHDALPSHRGERVDWAFESFSANQAAKFLLEHLDKNWQKYSGTESPSVDPSSRQLTSLEVIVMAAQVDETASRQLVRQLKHCAFAGKGAEEHFPLYVESFMAQGVIGQAFRSDHPAESSAPFEIAVPCFSYYAFTPDSKPLAGDAKAAKALESTFGPGHNVPPSRMLRGGAHLTGYPFLPFRLLKEQRATECDGTLDPFRKLVGGLRTRIAAACQKDGSSSNIMKIMHAHDAALDEHPTPTTHPGRFADPEQLKRENPAYAEIFAVPEYFELNQHARFPAWHGGQDWRAIVECPELLDEFAGTPMS